MFSSSRHMAATSLKKNKACKLVHFSQSGDDRGDHDEADKGDCAVLESQKFEWPEVDKKEKINDLFVFKENGEEINSLRADMPLRRRSEEVVKMQDRLQMSPIAVMFRGTLSGKDKGKGNRKGRR